MRGGGVRFAPAWLYQISVCLDGRKKLYHINLLSRLLYNKCACIEERIVEMQSQVRCVEHINGRSFNISFRINNIPPNTSHQVTSDEAEIVSSTHTSIPPSSRCHSPAEQARVSLPSSPLRHAEEVRPASSPSATPPTHLQRHRLRQQQPTPHKSRTTSHPPMNRNPCDHSQMAWKTHHQF